jgi:AcrR family transcriptional regulator
MERQESSSDRNNKLHLIIEAAQKRFGLYGVEKTSMREIADDIKLSKAALYYYFPDKENLYKSVLKKELDEFLVKISESVLKSGDPESLLREYAIARIFYFRKLINISRIRLESYSDLKPVLRETINNFREKEKEKVAEILQKGISDGIFDQVDTEKNALLFLDLLKCLRVSSINEKNSLFIGEDEYEQLCEKTNAFTELFIRGIRSRI